MSHLVVLLLEGRDHALGHGLVEEIGWLNRQHRVSFARVGLADPLDLVEYRKLGGLAGLRRALDTPVEEVVGDILASGLRGRGGAGFPAGIKWRTVLEADAEQKYVCCNADEGDSGTFADRMLMEGDPFTLLEGMAVAGVTVGASIGLIYVRSEYPAAIRTLRTAVDIACVDGWLGGDVLGSGRPFDVRVVEPMGAHLLLTGEVEGRPARAIAPPDAPIAPGTRIGLRPDPARLSWFDPDTGHRLGAI